MKRNNKWISLVIVLAVIVLLNVISQFVYHRFDFTTDKRFTLNDKTKKVLSSNDKPVIITVFLDGQLPPAFKRLQNAVKDLLGDFKANSKANIHIQFIDPLEGLTAAEQDTVIYNLYQNGIEATNLSVKTESGLTQKLAFPMAMVESDGKQMPVKLFQNLASGGNYEDNINRSIENLEYIFTSSLKKVIKGTNPRIGFTEANGELDDRQLHDAIATLSNSYEVGRVDLNTIDKEGLDKLKMLVIAKPRYAFTEAQKYKINYFVMNGGRVVWSIDQVRAELDSLQNTYGQMVVNSKLNLDDMLFMYGARINYDVLGDGNSGEIPVATGGVNGQIQLLPFMFYPIAQADTVQSLVKGLDGLKTEFPSTVDTIGNKNVRKHFIFNSSTYNRVYTVPRLFSLQMVASQPDPSTFKNEVQHLGALLEGNFINVFAGRPLPESIDAPYFNGNEGKEAKMVVLGDGDIFRNDLNLRDNSSYPLGFDRYTQFTFANKAFLLNLADYFTDEDNLIELRNKEVKIRLLDRLKVKEEKSKWQFINIVAPLLLLIFFAIFQHYYRKHKYAK